MASFHWVANGPRQVKGGITREDGEYVPEVDDWKDPELWERAGHIRKVPGPAPGPSPEPEIEVKKIDPSSSPEPPAVEPEPVLMIDVATDKDPIAEEILDAASKSLAEPIVLERREGMPESFEPKKLMLVGTTEIAPELTEDGAQILGAVQLMNNPEPEQATPSPSGHGLEMDEDVAAQSENEVALDTVGIGDDDDDGDDEDEDEDEYEPHTKSELLRMRKADLQDLALEWELVVGEANKPEIIAAILDAQEQEWSDD